MQTITGDLLQDSLLHLLYCALKEEKPALPTDLNWEALLQLANRQQVYNTVLPVLEKAAVLPPEQLQRWNDYRLTELQRTLYVNSQRQAVCADLEAQNIRYMFLKGLVLRALYPQTMMRQMSDNDILLITAQLIFIIFRGLINGANLHIISKMIVYLHINLIPHLAASYGFAQGRINTD